MILKINVNVLDFEFSKNPGNLDLFGSRDLAGRMIGYGCVDSSSDTIESVQRSKNGSSRASRYSVPVTMLIDPDCGMRMRTRETAFAKLKNMAEAAREVRVAL